jgi:hypothetical protein
MEGAPKHPFERIIGGSEEDKEKASKEFQNAYDTRSVKWSKYELEKTADEIEIIKKSEDFVDDIVRGYGIEPRQVPLDHIYVLKPNGVRDTTDGKIFHAIHNPLGSRIAVDRGESRLLFSSALAHEFFHAKSYRAGRVIASPDDAGLYRSGLTIFNIKDKNVPPGEEIEYFDDLDEGVTAELVKKFIDELGRDSEFAEEIADTQKYANMVTGYYRSIGASEEKISEFEWELKYIQNAKDKINSVLKAYSTEKEQNAFAAGLFTASREKGEIQFYERYEERKMFRELLDKLFEGSNGKFKTKEEIFDEFARAYFTGNYLTIARIIEEVLGKGAFRKLAEQTVKKANRKDSKVQKEDIPTE